MMLMPEDVQFEAMRVRTSEYSSEAESYRRWREIHVAQPRWWGRGLYLYVRPTHDCDRSMVATACTFTL